MKLLLTFLVFIMSFSLYAYKCDPSVNATVSVSDQFQDQVVILYEVENSKVTLDELKRFHFFLDQNPLKIIEGNSRFNNLALVLSSDKVTKGKHQFVIKGEDFKRSGLSASTYIYISKSNNVSESDFVGMEVNYRPNYPKTFKFVDLKTSKKNDVLKVTILDSRKVKTEVYAFANSQKQAFLGVRGCTGNYNFAPNETYTISIQSVLPNGKSGKKSQKKILKLNLQKP